MGGLEARHSDYLNSAVLSMAVSTIPHNMHIEKGLTTTGSDGTTEVTFSKAFGSSPVITATASGSATDNIIAVKITARSATGFTVTATRAYNNSNAVTPAPSAGIFWIAVGE